MSSRYTHDEKYIIIRYILDNEILSGLNGKTVWKNMEKAKIINRSWHSMRTQFKNTIINMLHLFDLTDDERKQILCGYGRNMKTHTSEFQVTVVGNHKSLDRDSDSDNIVHLTEENNTLEKGPKSDSETSSSLDLRFPVKRSCESTNECSRGELKSQDHQTYNSNKQINVQCNNEFTKDTNSVQENSFSLEEDTELILFFKSHEHKIHDKTAYNVFQNKTSSIRSCETLEDRFINHIIPNLFNYKCLTYDEMIVLYDRCDLDIPEELQLRIRNVVAQRSRNKKVGTSKVTANKATQATEPVYQNRQSNLYRVGKYIGWSDNGVKHIFIPNIDKDHSKKRREIHDQFIIPDENIHVVSMQAYTTMNDIINCDIEFKLLCNEWLETGKFNSTHVEPVLNQMKQINIDFTGNELDETMQCEKET